MGRAEVRQTYSVSRLGTIAGCYVIDGVIIRAMMELGSSATISWYIRGRLLLLRGSREDVREVATGYECGIMIENFNDLKSGDILENFVIEKIAAKL